MTTKEFYKEVIGGLLVFTTTIVTAYAFISIVEIIK